MGQAEFEAMLRAWGRAYGERPDIEPREDERAPDIHPLAVGIRFAPGSRTTAVARAMHRGGQERRRLMASGLESCGIRMVPATYVDPVPGSRSCKGGGSSTESKMQPVVEAVQTAWLTLYRFDTLRANVVQHEYQRRGMTQGDKAAILGIKLRRYRDELDSGRTWLHGRLAA